MPSSKTGVAPSPTTLALRIRDQILRDDYPHFSATAWAKTHLFLLLRASGAANPLLESSRRSSSEIVGLESIGLESLREVAVMQSGETALDIRFSVSARLSGRAGEREEAVARLRWALARLSPRKRQTVHRVVTATVDVRVELDSAGKLKSAHLANFGYARGRLGLP